MTEQRSARTASGQDGAATAAPNGVPEDGHAADLATLTRAQPAPRTALQLLNRELSWLDFNTRVLAITESPDVPLLERAKFLAIYSRNLDEFFQVRVGGLKQQVVLGVTQRSADGMSPREQLREIRVRVSEMVRRHTQCFLDDITPGLARAGIGLRDWASLDEGDRAHLSDVFGRTIFPVLTPLAVDPKHPFPYISNLSLNLAVVIADGDAHRIARVKVPQILQRFVPLPDGERFVALEQVIAAHLQDLFPRMRIVAHHPFRLTRFRSSRYALSGTRGRRTRCASGSFESSSWKPTTSTRRPPRSISAASGICTQRWTAPT
jgi:polyphosphate kinase